MSNNNIKHFVRVLQFNIVNMQGIPYFESRSANNSNITDRVDSSRESKDEMDLVVIYSIFHWETIMLVSSYHTFLLTIGFSLGPTINGGDNMTYTKC